MSNGLYGFTPAYCRHCKYSDSWLWPGDEDFKRYTCPICGDYRVSKEQEAAFEAGSWQDPGRFETDDDGVRWLTA